MRLTNYFLPTLKETPKEASIVSHRLMLRAGLVRQMASGIYAWLPLGLKVMKKIENVVRKEHERAGIIECLMPTIQPASMWEDSGRYEDYGKELLKITDRHSRALLYGPTNEEMITKIVKDNIKTYHDLPLNLYHIQWKFRDEVRPRFGVMRGREFLMKDAYSFDLTKKEAKKSYEKMFALYLVCFKKMGLRAIPFVADTGAIGGDLSHEFVIMSSTGESNIFYHKDLSSLSIPDEVDYEGDLASFIKPFLELYAATDDKLDKAQFEKLPKDKQMQGKGIEVGHIFYFGTKYTDKMSCQIADRDGKPISLHCGSYGIGISRLVGAVIEASHDEAGIIFPSAIAPFHIGILNLKQGDKKTDELSEMFYKMLNDASNVDNAGNADEEFDVLYDNRDIRAGEKFSQMDLIGLPFQAIISPKGAEKRLVEIKNRQTGERKTLPIEQAFSYLTETINQAKNFNQTENFNQAKNL